MDEEKKTVVYEIRDAEKEDELKRAEDILEKVEKVLGDIPIGWSIAISRREPGWARGHLETIAVNEENPLDLDYLAQTWGGEVLTARVKDDTGKYIKSVDIPMYSYKPKSWGEDLVHPNFRHAQPTQQKLDRSDPLGSIDSILSIVERLKGREEKQPVRDNSLDLGIIELLLRNQLASQKQSGPMGGVEQFLQMAGAFKELKGLFGNDEQQKQFDENDIIGKVGGILDTYFKYRSTVEQNKPKAPRIAPPAPPRAMIGPVQQNPGIPPPAAPSPPAIVEQLASLDPKTAAEAVLLALDRMSEEHREKALSVFFNHLGVEEEEETFDDNGNKVQNMHNATSADGSPKGER